MPLIQLKNVKKNYMLGQVETQALKGVDLNINKEEFVAIWGPSGSGKTTVLNIIGTIDHQTSGDVFIEEQSVSELSDNKRTELRNDKIGFIFQKFNLIPVLTALENVMLPLQIRKESGPMTKTKAMQRLKDVGIHEFADHRPDKLSGGQQQRVAVARALVTDPAIVIADEPTANLDSENAQNIINIMKKLNETEKTTFIFSTHDQRLLDHVNRLVCLEDGMILKEGE